MIREAYHTQEHWLNKPIYEPIECIRPDAWFGDAFYFWLDEDDALFWGDSSKRKTGKYEIYKCKIDCEDVLDTVFEEKSYEFWIKNIENAAKKIIKHTGQKPTLKEINDYFTEKGVWDDIDGIMFQDIAKNPALFLVKGLQYKKRIQIALYNKSKISKFALHFTGVCN